MVIRGKHLNCLLCKELVKAQLAVGDHLLSEVALLDGLDRGLLMALEVQLKLNNVLAELAIEGAVGLFSLRLCVDSLNNLKEPTLDLLGHCELVHLLAVALLELVLEATKDVLAKLGKLLIEVVGKYLVNDKPNLLLEVLLGKTQVVDLLRLLSELLHQLVGLLSLELLFLSLRLAIKALLASALASVEVSIFSIAIVVPVVVGAVVARTRLSVVALAPFVVAALAFHCAKLVGPRELRRPEHLGIGAAASANGGHLEALEELHSLIRCEGFVG